MLPRVGGGRLVEHGEGRGGRDVSNGVQHAENHDEGYRLALCTDDVIQQSNRTDEERAGEVDPRRMAVGAKVAQRDAHAPHVGNYLQQRRCVMTPAMTARSRGEAAEEVEDVEEVEAAPSAAELLEPAAREAPAAAALKRRKMTGIKEKKPP